MARTPLLFASAAAALTLAAPSAEASCVATTEPEGPVVAAPALSVDVRALSDTYRRGQHGQLRVEVRTGAVKGSKAPAGVKVVITLRHGSRELDEVHAVTKDGGVAEARFAIPRSWPAGDVAADASASYELVPGFDCQRGLVGLTGTRHVDRLLTVRA